MLAVAEISNSTNQFEIIYSRKAEQVLSAVTTQRTNFSGFRLERSKHCFELIISCKMFIVLPYDTPTAFASPRTSVR